MSITADQVRSLGGSSTVYSGGNKVGKVGQVYLDDETGEPSWVTVKTGLFGNSETFVPLLDAQLDGEDVQVDFDEATIKGAPRIEADGELSPQEEDELYRYYGLTDQHQTATTTTGGTTDATEASMARSGTEQQTGVATDPVGDRDTSDVADRSSGPDRSSDDAMTRSEERLNVGTASRESGRARLRKYVTTEQVTQTVPVRHEEVTLEREPITEANQAAAGSGPQISEEEHEVTLHEDVPVVDKDVEAVERIKLGKETVTEDATVSEEVRKENVEMVNPQESGDRQVSDDQLTGDQATGGDQQVSDNRI